ncbi:hypothetical protein DFH09DRAFT_1343716 [Mycena vulgaris]|nr:hypothetical protein DFH09DRAFT_1343716 [Mycena vulgaris]
MRWIHCSFKLTTILFTTSRVCSYITEEDLIIDYTRKTHCQGIVDGVESDPNFDAALEVIILDGDMKLLLAIAGTDPFKGLPGRRPKDEKILKLKKQLNETSRPKWYFEA